MVSGRRLENLREPGQHPETGTGYAPTMIGRRRFLEVLAALGVSQALREPAGTCGGRSWWEHIRSLFQSADQAGELYALTSAYQVASYQTGDSQPWLVGYGACRSKSTAAPSRGSVRTMRSPSQDQ